MEHEADSAATHRDMANAIRALAMDAVMLGARRECRVARAGYCLRGRGGCGAKEGLWGGHHRAWRVTRARL
jgi:hypothetical protein